MLNCFNFLLSDQKNALFYLFLSLSLYPFSLYDQLKEPVWFQNFSVNALRRSFASSKNTIRKKPCCNSNSTPCIELDSPTEFADEKQKTTQNNTVNVLVVNAISTTACAALHFVPSSHSTLQRATHNSNSNNSGGYPEGPLTP